jgi:inosine/xanthosine triphosphatase
MPKVVVASKNKTKLNAVKQAFGLLFVTEEFQFEDMPVENGGGSQPASNKETYAGALNRVEEISKKVPADYWVGIESGIDERDGECALFSWIIVKSKDGRIGKAKTATFYLPDKIYAPMKGSKDLDNAADIVFEENQTGHKHGTVGILTDNLIDRTRYYVDPIILALIPFKNPDLY